MGVLDASRISDSSCAGSGSVDSQHRCAMAHAAAKPSELQNCASALSNLVLPRRLRLVLTDVANELRENGALDEEECFIDATFVMAKGGGSEIGTQRSAEKAMKIMAIVDRHGLAALGQHARREPSRSPFGAAMLRLLHDRSQAGEF